MSKKLRDFRKRLSLQNHNLGKNKLNEKAEKMGLENLADDNEPEIEEEDTLKNWKKEEEAKKYLNPIAEEEDPLKFFDRQKAKEAEDEDPLLYMKSKEENPSDLIPKIMGVMISEELDEKALNEKIKAHLLPDQINIEKNTVNKKYTMEERKKKMEKRYKTSMRLSHRRGFEPQAKDKLMKRLQNYKKDKNLVNKESDNKKTNVNKNIGNTLLSAEEQVSVENKKTPVVTKKIDLSLMEKKKDK
jgi:hypothetical protein